jgi:hypothetical protein
VETKISDDGLRRMTREGKGSASVIVELDVPHPQATGDRDAFRESPWKALSFEMPSEREQQRAEDVKSRARALLEEVADAPPVPLADEGSFAVQVSGKTLGALARSPLVRAIHLSQLRR